MPYTTIGGIGVMGLSENASCHNAANVFTLNNVVMLCDDVTLTNNAANAGFATLSDEQMWPLTPINLPVCATDNGVTEIVALTIEIDGVLSINKDVSNGIVHLNGICFNANSKYYTPEIGNIFNNGTSPLTAQGV